MGGLCGCRRSFTPCKVKLPFSGQPSIFVRLSGCNLRCTWCDTDFESSQWQPSLHELLDEIDTLRPDHCQLVVITGGEPLRQNIAPLVEALLQRRLKVQIETNGTLWIDLPEVADLILVCSPKTAYLHPRILERAQVFKYVIQAECFNEADGLPSLSTQSEAPLSCEIRRPPKGAQVYVMPLDSASPQANEANVRACVEIAKKFGYKLTLQSHKLAGFR